MSRLSGKPFEAFVKELYEAFGESISLTQREFIPDIHGSKREFDLTFRTMLNGVPILGVVECRDHQRKISISAVEAFSKKCESVNANLRIIVSLNGFTKGAVEKARKYGIEIFTPFDSSHLRFSKQVFWPIYYVEFHRVGPIVGEIDFVRDEQDKPVEANSLSISGLNLVDILLRHLVFRCNLLTPNEKFVFRLKPCESYGYVACNLGRRKTERLSVGVTFKTVIRRKNVPIANARGFTDWKTNLFKPKVGSDLVTSGFKVDELKDGEIVQSLPPSDGPVSISVFQLAGIDRKFKSFERSWNIERLAKLPSKKN